MKFLAVSSLFALAAASPISKRNGPSGEVISPPGGTDIVSMSGTGIIPFSYKTVNQENSDHTDYYRTAWVDLTLVPRDNYTSTGNITIASGLAPKEAGATIDTQFAAKQACGAYRLVVRETQIHNMGLLDFQAAAPSIDIHCSPIQ